jgi:hypothetical protein
MSHPPSSHSPAEFSSRRQRSLWFTAAIAFAAILGAYFIIAYVVLPLGWIGYAHRHPALEDIPNITYTGDDHPGDPINVALIGSEHDLKAGMIAAGWYPADPVTLKSSLEIAAGTVLKRPYDDAPVSPLYLYRRKQDLAFEQPVGNDPRQRHHVRFWKSEKLDDQGRPLWAGSATYDKRVGLSHTTGEITHHIAADVDAERDHLAATLKTAGALVSEAYVDGFHKVTTGKNGGGDPWHTDGRLLQAELKPTSPAFPAAIMP